MTVFTIDEVKKTFTNGEVQEEILKGINFSLEKGKITDLVGTSGTWKSTILTIAAGLQSATEGEILFGGKDMAAIRQEGIRKIQATAFGFDFQSSHLVHFLTVEE